MKVIFDVKCIRVTSMDNAVINVGKNWNVTQKGKGKGARDHVERLGCHPATGEPHPSAGDREYRAAPGRARGSGEVEASAASEKAGLPRTHPAH